MTVPPFQFASNVLSNPQELWTILSLRDWIREKIVPIFSNQDQKDGEIYASLYLSKIEAQLRSLHALGKKVEGHRQGHFL